MKWLEYQFLDAPFQNLCDLELAFGGAGDLVNPAELAELLAGLSKDDKDCSFEREFVSATGKVIRALEKLRWPIGTVFSVIAGLEKAKKRHP
jgi:hypothetical protein